MSKRLHARRVVGIGLLALAGNSHAVYGQATDTLVVQVELQGGGRALSLAVLTEDGISVRIEVPAVQQVTGARVELTGLASLTELEEQLGTGLHWYPERLAVVIRDPRHVLPVSRERLDRLRAEARARGPESGWLASGPRFTLTVDDRGESLTEAGYGWKRVRAQAAYSSASGARWSASANPLARLWLTYADSDRSDPRLSLRTSFGRTWVSASHDGRRSQATAAGALGPLLFFGASDGRGAITWRGPTTVQLGIANERVALRIAFGKQPLSVFSVPMVP